MPPKRAAAGAGAAPQRQNPIRNRRAPEHLDDDVDGPGQGPAPGPDQPNNQGLVAAAEFEAFRAEVDAAMQANTALLEAALAEFREQRAGHADRGTNSPTPVVQPQNDILLRWPWVDRSMIEEIANGEFDIYDLPKLHRDENLRNRHLAKTVDGIMQPLSGARPHLVQARTKIQNSLRNLDTFISAWMIYCSIRISYVPERGPGLTFWTERVSSYSSLQYEFPTIVNYVVA
jgi:hypothetical protein